MHAEVPTTLSKKTPSDQDPKNQRTNNVQSQDRTTKVKNRDNRHAKNRKKQNQKILQGHFKEGHSVFHISKMTGIKMETVSKCLNQFTEEFVRTNDTDFILSMLFAKELLLYQLDNNIEELQALQVDIKEQLDLKPKKTLIDSMIKTIMRINKLQVIKFRLETNPMYSSWYYKGDNHKNPNVKFWIKRV